MGKVDCDLAPIYISLFLNDVVLHNFMFDHIASSKLKNLDIMHELGS